MTNLRFSNSQVAMARWSPACTAPEPAAQDDDVSSQIDDQATTAPLSPQPIRPHPAQRSPCRAMFALQRFTACDEGALTGEYEIELRSRTAASPSAMSY